MSDARLLLHDRLEQLRAGLIADSDYLEALLDAGRCEQAREVLCVRAHDRLRQLDYVRELVRALRDEGARPRPI